MDIGEPDQGGGLLAAEGLLGAGQQPEQVPAGLLLGVGAVPVTAARLLRWEVADHGQAFHRGIVLQKGAPS